MEFVFWGLCYITGRILVSLISLGKWRAEAINEEKDIKGKRKKQNGFTLIKGDGKDYLGAFAVAFIGMLFWLLVMVLFLIT